MTKQIANKFMGVLEIKLILVEAVRHSNSISIYPFSKKFDETWNELNDSLLLNIVLGATDDVWTTVERITGLPFKPLVVSYVLVSLDATNRTYT